MLISVKSTRHFISKKKNTRHHLHLEKEEEEEEAKSPYYPCRGQEDHSVHLKRTIPHPKSAIIFMSCKCPAIAAILINLRSKGPGISSTKKEKHTINLIIYKKSRNAQQGE